MKKLAPEPTKIVPSPQSPLSLQLQWSTGENFELAYRMLRFECPCASCVDEHSGERMIRMENIPLDIRVSGAAVVGRYALNIRFSDHHDTGMFHFDRLYELCQTHAMGSPSSAH